MIKKSLLFVVLFSVVFLFGCDLLDSDNNNDNQDDQKEVNGNGDDDDDVIDDEPNGNGENEDGPNGQNGEATLHAITFNTLGGLALDELNIADNETVEVLPTPERRGYTFLGWYLDEQFDDAFDHESVITKDLVLFAKWSLDLSGVVPIEVIYTLEEETNIIIEGVVTAFDFSSFILMDDTGYAQVYGYYEDQLDIGHQIRVDGVIAADGHIPMVMLDESQTNPYEVLKIGVDFHHEPKEISIENLAKLTLEDNIPIGYYRIAGVLVEDPIGYARFRVETSDSFIFIETSWQGFDMFEDNVGNVVDINAYITRFREMDPYLNKGHYLVHFFTSDDFNVHEPNPDEEIVILKDYIKRQLNETIVRYDFYKPLPSNPYGYEVELNYEILLSDAALGDINIMDGSYHIKALSDTVEQLTIAITLTKNDLQEAFEVTLDVKSIEVTSLDDILTMKNEENYYIHAVMLGHIFYGEGLIMDANTHQVMVIETPKFGGLPDSYDTFFAYGGYRSDGLNDIFYVDHIEGIIAQNDAPVHSFSKVAMNPESLYEDELYEPFLYVHMAGYYDSSYITQGYPGLFTLNQDYYISILASFNQFESFYAYQPQTHMVISGFLVKWHNNQNEVETYIVFEDFISTAQD